MLYSRGQECLSRKVKKKGIRCYCFSEMVHRGRKTISPFCLGSGYLPVKKEANSVEQIKKPCQTKKMEILFCAKLWKTPICLQKKFCLVSDSYNRG